MTEPAHKVTVREYFDVYWQIPAKYSRSVTPTKKQLLLLFWRKLMIESLKIKLKFNFSLIINDGTTKIQEKYVFG